MTDSNLTSLTGLSGLSGVADSDEAHPTAWQTLLERSNVGELDLLRQCAELMGLELLESLDGEHVSGAFTSHVPVGFARKHAVVGLEDEADTIAVATACALDFRPLDDVAKVLRCRVRPVLAPREEIMAALESAYKEQMRAESKVSEDLGDLEGLIGTTAALAASEDLLDLSRRPPLVRLLDRILLQALERDASDVHFQPAADRLQVRFRIDGVLHDMIELPRSIQPAVTSRIKVMGRMDVAERRLAQDGRCTVTVGGDHADLRISSLPTAEGEEVVLRLLHRDSRLLTLGELGMSPQTAAAFDGLIHATHGIVLVTGPTGCGKTTTLYAALQELDSRSTHVVTLEDPIEYQLEGISQSQVNYKKGLTFATGLRNVLRQDPDIIMVGEIRDLDTARMAVQSALTGHLVLSTLHTNDSISAITRMLDMGIESYLVSGALIAIEA
ncbi:MAG: GspE/PulE family protein, partial [Candidatus Brocadiia bacterium]